MIDLRKPLDGVPGLLLMAALVLFGATLGVTAALALSWVEMKDSIANFLGGVVGAGLGAALAVFGAVYVQHLQRKALQATPANGLVIHLRKVRDALVMLDLHIEGPIVNPTKKEILKRLQAASLAAEELPDCPELSDEVNLRIHGRRSDVTFWLRRLRDELTAQAEIKMGEGTKSHLRELQKSIEAFMQDLRSGRY